MIAAQRYQYGDLTLRKRKTKSAVWQFRYMQNGKRNSVLIGTVDKLPTKADAERAVEHLRMEINRDSAQQQFHSVTVTGLFDRFMKEYVPRHCRKETARVYRSNFKNYVKPRWGEVFVGDVKPMAILDWLGSLPKSRQVKSHIRSLIHVMFNAAILWEITDRNPVTPVRQSRKRLKTPRILTPEQLRSYLTELEEPYRTMVITATCTGLRACEVLALKWMDINFENLTIQIERSVVSKEINDTKTESSEALLPIDPSLGEVLLAYKEKAFYREDSDFVFANAYGKPRWRDSVLADHLKPAAVRAEVGNIGWHTFRHTYASALHHLGTSLAVQKELMRHADIQTTMNIYTQSVDSEKREAVKKTVRYLWKD